MTLELFIKRLIIKTCAFGWETPARNLREKEGWWWWWVGERGNPPGKHRHARTHIQFLFVVLYLAQPLQRQQQQQQYLFSCRWKHMHGGVFIHIRAPLSHVKLHTLTRTRACEGPYTLTCAPALPTVEKPETLPLIIQDSHSHVHIYPLSCTTHVNGHMCMHVHTHTHT